VTKIKVFHKLLKPYFSKILIAGISALLVSAVPGSTVLLIKPVIDRAILEKNLNLLKIIALAVLALYFVKGVLRFLHSYLMVFVAQSVGRDLRNKIYSHLLKVELSELEKKTSGEINALILNDVGRIEIAIPSLILLIREPFTLIGLMTSAFMMNWKLSIFAGVIIPIGLLPMVKITGILKTYGKTIQENIGRISSLINETVGGIKVIRSFLSENFMKKRFSKLNETIVKGFLRYALLQEGLSPFMELLGAIGVALVIFYGGYQVIRGETTPGSFLAFITACGLMYEPFKRLNASLTLLQHSFASYERIENLLRWKEEDEGGKLEFKGLKKGIKFEGVSFSYGEEEILKDITFEAKCGEKIAIVGQTGVGKTTLISLLLRFYREKSGRILLDGEDINKFSVSSLRRHISFVPQEPFLFDGSVIENIRTGKEDAKDEEIIEASEKADIKHLVQNQKELLVGERGEMLSGGERQRVAIARALLKDASIVILDEATSSLDTETEKRIENAMKELMKGKTVFIIAHRLSTVKNADRIIVLKDGRIVEQGRYEELLKLRGEFYRIYREQIEGYGN
jgi:subfamily B ATP-binding cassette protein MsbA